MLPQLDCSHYTSQIFWLVVCFCILILAMMKVFIPRINSKLKAREDAITTLQREVKRLQCREAELQAQVKNKEEESIVKVAQIFSDVEKRHNEVLMTRVKNLNNEHKQLSTRIKEKYEKEIHEIAKQEKRSIEMIAQFAISKLTGGKYKE